MKRYIRTTLVPLAPLLLLCLYGNATAESETPIQFGTPTHPFAADSPWNIRPVNPVLGDAEIPTSDYFPAIGPGPYSTKSFIGNSDAPAQEVLGAKGKRDIWDYNQGVQRAVTIEHWPADLTPATGSDGHADIAELDTGMLHSFWQLRRAGQGWTAIGYGWTRLSGRGWGDPADFYQGTRAVGIPSSAGLIRRDEIDDGQPIYRHALAMSLTYNGLARSPAYIYPATAADHDAQLNSGKIPEGALLMLPPTYDTSKIASQKLRKVAETLKVYGAYVVDRNVGTPFYIYVENGSDFNPHSKGWNVAAANELQRMRAALRQVVSAKGWLDGHGKPMTPQRPTNLLSMRGPWRGEGNRYDSNNDQLAIDAGASARSTALRDIGRVNWAAPRSGARCRFSVQATGGATLRLQVRSADYSRQLFDTGELADGAGATLPCPTGPARYDLSATGGPSAGTVRATMAVQDDSTFHP
jgi:hypothetical protein